MQDFNLGFLIFLNLLSKGIHKIAKVKEKKKRKMATRYTRDNFINELNGSHSKQLSS